LIRLRPFRNGDPPALAGLWNRALPERGVVRPLGPHEFDALVLCRVGFDPEGLIVAEDGGRVVGFAHAGFGPDSPPGPPQRLDRELGTIAMLAVEPGPDEPAVGRGLLAEAEGYLERRGARVIYAGGQTPLDPFYRGVYGGSEWAGILESHDAFRRAATAAGYDPVSTTILLDLDVAGVEVRDPRAPLLRRLARIEVEEDAAPADWWEATSLGQSSIVRFRLVSKADDAVLARASAWDMAAFGRIDGRARTGVYDLAVEPQHRRKGYGRHLVAEILRKVKDQWGEIVSVQTRSGNEPALGLYRSMGFRAVDSAILYRRRGHLHS
jgi:ribosomal protein S18 acetylase RimI-like enzyme